MYAGGSRRGGGATMAGQDYGELDQEWAELLDEVRVLLPAVAVLFAFLLTVPFSQRFDEVADSDKTVYLVAFLAAAAATLLLVAPSALHRLLWRQHRKDEELKLATGFSIAGILCLAVAVASVVFVVTSVVSGTWLPALATASTVALILGCWFAAPLALRLRGRGTTRSG